VADAPALARLVGDAASFLEDRWGRRPWYTHRADVDGFADLLSLDDVDRIVASSGLRAPAFRLVREGHTIPTHQVTRRVRIGSRPVDDLVDVAAVHGQVAEGATLVLQGLHRSWPPVATLCRDLELTFTHPVQANAYLTPPVATGLRLHGDPHDVFAVQTHGRKRWVVHPAYEDEPWEVVLEPGDVLYLPAATLHAPQSLDGPSLHLTIGVRTVTWRHVVQRALEAAVDRPELDRPLPAGWAEDPYALRTELEAHLEDVRADLAGGDALERAADGFWSRRVPDRAGGLRDLFELEMVADDTWLRRRVGNTFRVEVVDDRVVADLGDRRLRMPAPVAPLLERIGATERLRPRDLDDLADEPSRLVLCRRLVREGLLTIDRDEDAGTSRG
jgi:bifunctional lysine-specific demethylase and histidyl-hydroxylase NO66